jgi:molybdate transport system regulatory protein
MMTALKANKLAVRSKVWLELDGVPFMGEGRLAVLKAVEQHGTLLKAAEETHISYRRARGMIREMETCLGRPLVITIRGGKAGGGSEITEVAKDLIRRFELQVEDLKAPVDAIFKRIFSDFFST